jgi:hypothetical protein
VSIRKKNEQMGEKLVALGFLKFADATQQTSLKINLVRSFDIYDEGNYRISHIDAEELAEGSFDFFLPRLNKVLEKRGFQLMVEESDTNEISHEILINDETIQLFTDAELEDNSCWETAPRNFFAKVNELLRNSLIEERFYLLYGGNDLHTMLLTDEQFSVISKYYDGNKIESPYLP